VLSFLTKIGKFSPGSFRSEIGVLLVLFALTILVWLPRLNGPLDPRWDASAYYILGTSLAEGKGYKLLNEPGEIDAVQYPPLLPAIIAVHQWFAGTSDFFVVGHWLRISFFILFIAYILSAYALLRIYLPLRYAFLATLIFLFHYNTIYTSDNLLTEIPYGFVIILFLLCHQKSGKRVYSVLSVILLASLFALRTAGVAMLAAWIGESLLNREFKKAFLRITLSLIPILCWQSYIAAVEHSPQYRQPAYEYQRADYMYPNVTYAKNVFRLKNSFSPELGPTSLKDVAGRFLYNSAAVPLWLGEAVSSGQSNWSVIWDEFDRRLAPFPPSPRILIRCALIIIGLLALGGICLQLFRRQWIIPLYVLISIALMCLTPWPWVFPRYLVPLSPLLILSLFLMLISLQALSRRVLPAGLKFTGVILTSTLLALILILEVAIVLHMYRNSRPWVVYEDRNGQVVKYRLFYFYEHDQNLNVGLDWLNRRARPEDVVAVQEPHWAYLHTGLKAVLPPFELNPEKAQHLLDSVPATYLIVDENDYLTRKYTEAVVKTFPDRWKRVFSTPDKRLEIYERVSEN